MTQQSIFGFTEGKFNVETVFLGNFTSLNKYILQQYTEEIKFTQSKGWLGFDIYFYQIFTKDHAPQQRIKHFLIFQFSILYQAKIEWRKEASIPWIFCLDDKSPSNFFITLLLPHQPNIDN